MLILATAACPDAHEVGAPFSWPGPVIVAALPGHGLGRAGLRALEADAVVIECLEPPASLGSLLCDLAVRLPWLLRDNDGPLLLARAPVSAGALGERRARALMRPGGVEADWGSPPAPGRAGSLSAEAGLRLRSLLLGAEVGSHPLVPDVLALLGAQPPGDVRLVTILSTVCGGELFA